MNVTTEVTPMAKTPTASESQMTPLLQQRLREHKKEVERLREEYGNPQEALGRLLREFLDADAFAPMRPSTNGQFEVTIDEEDDDELSGR
jgi:hypothetical protein